MGECEAISNPDTVWPHMCPNLPAAYLLAALFCLTTVVHIFQMFKHRKWYSWVIIVSGVLQTVAYVLLVLSIKYVTNTGFYSYWFTLMMVAPVWTNAFAYMVMGRAVYNFTETGSVFRIKSWNFGLIFVLLDVLAFFIQVGGAMIASGHGDNDKLMIGIHVYMGGIGFQLLCIILFLVLASRLHVHLRAQPPNSQRRVAFQLLYVQYVVVILIIVRIVFRLIEYSDGIKSSIPRQEQYQYIFDSALMFVALVLYNIFHPGRLMSGKESDMPKRKERKAMNKAGELPHGRAGEYLPLTRPGNCSPDPAAMELGQRVAARDFTADERYAGYEPYRT